MKVGLLYRQMRDRFRDAGLPTPEIDARFLASRALGFSLSELLFREDELVPDAALKSAAEFTEQRLSGRPVGRILGEREFFGRSFRLNAATLEPRPDTEVLVEAVLAKIAPAQSATLCDIGTGSGAIAITLLCERPLVQAVAVDISEAALDCARENAENNKVAARFFPVKADYGSALSGGFDWIISNPPYIRTDVLPTLHPEVLDCDPIMALDGGSDGLEAYRRIVSEGWNVLRDGGGIALEIGYDQASDVERQLRHQGFVGIEIIQDLAGHDRVVVAKKS